VARRARPKAEAKMPLENWPICTTMGTMGSEADWAQLDRDFAAGKKALVAEDWNGAITALKLPHCATRARRVPWRLRPYRQLRLLALPLAMERYQAPMVFDVSLMHLAKAGPKTLVGLGVLKFQGLLALRA
jgi:hypothetical protein